MSAARLNRNMCHLTGHLGKKQVLKQVGSGWCWEGTIATKNFDPKKKNECTWHSFKFYFDKESLMSFLKRLKPGSMVTMIGSYMCDIFTPKDAGSDVKTKKYFLRVDNVLENASKNYSQ